MHPSSPLLQVPPRCPCCDEIGPATWRDMSEAQRSHWVLYVGELHCKPCVIQKRTGRKPETVRLQGCCSKRKHRPHAASAAAAARTGGRTQWQGAHAGRTPLPVPFC